MYHSIKTKKRSITIFIGFLAVLFLFSGCAKRNNAINNNVITKNNQEKTQIKLSKYSNPKYGFNFKYPDELNIIKDEETDKRWGYWGTRMETADFKEKFIKEGSPMLIVSGFKMIIFADTTANITTFDELKKIKQLGFGGIPFAKEEVKEINSRKFFIQTQQKEGNNIGWRISTLYKPNLVIEIIILGVDKYEKNMKTTIDYLLESFH